MEDNNTSQDQGYTHVTSTCFYGVYSYIIHNHSHITSGYYNYSNFTQSCDYQHLDNLLLVWDVMTWIIICIGLPLTLVAIYFLYSEVRNDHVAPIYIINLLISDLIQLCCMFVRVAPHVGRIKCNITCYVYDFCLAASVSFMVCVALERYLVIACPMWYRFRRNIKCCVLVCVVVWVLPLVKFFSPWFLDDLKPIAILQGIFLLLPLPLFVVFLGGTLKALSASTVPSDEKRRILGVLVLVLLIYILLFLPRSINFLTDKPSHTFWILSILLIRLSPLADLVLYVFIRKGTTDKLLASVCCCRKDRIDVSISTA